MGFVYLFCTTQFLGLYLFHFFIIYLFPILFTNSFILTVKSFITGQGKLHLLFLRCFRRSAFLIFLDYSFFFVRLISQISSFHQFILTTAIELFTPPLIVFYGFIISLFGFNTAVRIASRLPYCFDYYLLLYYSYPQLSIWLYLFDHIKVKSPYHIYYFHFTFLLTTLFNWKLDFYTIAFTYF